MQRKVIHSLVLIGLMATLGLSTQPMLAQPSPAGGSRFLPDIRILPVVEITDAARFTTCKGFCPGVHGHVRNNAKVPVYAVQLQADFYDSAGQLFKTATVAPALPVLFPGESSPFEVFATTNTFPPIQNFTYALRTTDYSYTSAVTYQPVTVVSTQVRWYIYEVEQVFGTVRNDAIETLDHVQVFVSDRAGNYALVATFETLRPGATMPFASFHLGWNEESDDATTITVQAVGIVQP